MPVKFVNFAKNVHIKWIKFYVFNASKAKTLQLKYFK